MVKHFLGRADLLNPAVFHNDYTVAQSHSFSLVVGNIYKGGVDTLTQFYYLGAHLVAKLCVEV